MTLSFTSLRPATWSPGRGLAYPQGDGSLATMTHYPPLFPLTLAALSFLGLEATTAARLVNVLAFGVNLMLVGWVAYRLTNHRALALLAALLCFFSDVLIEVHVWGVERAAVHFILARLYSCTHPLFSNPTQRLADRRRNCRRAGAGHPLYRRFTYCRRYGDPVFLSRSTPNGAGRTCLFSPPSACCQLHCGRCATGS